MPKNLVIVESPTKTKSIGKYLGKDFVVKSSVGHIRDLPKSKIGVDVDNNFEPEYIQVKGKAKVVSELSTAAKDSKIIYLATDPDREGEAIAWHVKYLLQYGKSGSKAKIKDDVFKRVTFHEITQNAVQEAMKHPGEIASNLVDAQQARRVLDRLVGYSLSPVLWRKVRRGLSAGRVQSVALRLIVEKEAEINAFKPVEYWEIKVKLNPDKSTASVDFETLKTNDIIVDLFEVDGQKIEIQVTDKKTKSIQLNNQEKVGNIVIELKKAHYAVESVERKQRSRNPFPPLITSTLQRAAANVFGWSGKNTMRLAQQLYEAGMITYHRTDSTNLSADAVNQAREYIESKFGKDFLPTKPNVYTKKAKNAQEAHEAIRVTDINRLIPESTHTEMTDQHKKLYQLIWQRFVASQMTPAIYDQTTIIVAAQINGKTKYHLRTTGSIMKFKGWLQAIDKKENNDVILPDVKANDPLNYIDLSSLQKFTEPPARFNDASLIKELEKRGIGRPSTYASIISVLDDRGYIERIERRFHPTVIGKTVCEFLVKYFPTILDYDFTAEMEEDLDRIANGEKNWKKIMAEFWKPFKKTLDKAQDSADRADIPVEPTDKDCPECKQAKLVIRTGRFGRFLSCSRYPECKHTEALVDKLENFPCPECGADVVVKRTRKGRTFFGCSAYPKCNYASWVDPRTPEQKQTTDTEELEVKSEKN